MPQTKAEKAAAAATAKAVKGQKDAAKKAEAEAAKKAKADAKAAPKAKSVAAEAAQADLAAKIDAGVLEGGEPSPIKPNAAKVSDAKFDIEKMSEAELDAFERDEPMLVRHTPGILGAIAARRSDFARGLEGVTRRSEIVPQ